MVRNVLTVVGFAALFAACGVDSQADVGTGSFEPELEIAEGELASSKVSSWFPMAEGNTWTLQTASGATRTVSYSDVEGGVAWLDGMVPDGRWAGIATGSPNTLYTWNDNGYWEAFIRFGYAKLQWQWGSGACGTFTAKRSATGRKVVTPAGTFTDTRSIEFTLKPSPTARCAAPSFSEFTFAANVGLVQIKTPAGEVFNLTSAKVGTKTWPQTSGGGLIAKLSTDKASYSSTGNTIVCITTPCPGNEIPATAKLTYTITNAGTTSKTWQFSSGCQTNTQLFDSKGAVVKSLEIARLCIQALTSFTLAPGQSKTFTEELQLTGDNGQLLDGDYTAKMYLQPMNNAPAMEATAKFNVRIVY